MNEFWDEEITKGYYDKVIVDGLSNGRSIQANWHNITFNKVSNRIKKNIKHLDYACGPGTLIGRYTQANSVGVDIAQKQIEYANENFSNKGKFYTISQFQKEKYGNYFDVITIMGLFEFLKDDEIIDLLNDLHSQLDDNGKLISTTLNFQTALNFILFFLNKFSENNYSDQHINKFDMSRIEKLLLKTKFSNIEVKKFMTFGVFFSIISNSFGNKINKLLEKFFSNNFGFLLFIELKK